jgi:hypothetical protein
VTKGALTLLGTGESLKSKVQLTVPGAVVASLVEPSRAPSRAAGSRPGIPGSQGSGTVDDAVPAGAGAHFAVGTVSESCLVTEKVSSVAFSRDGGRFVAVTGKVVQVFAMVSAQHGGGVGRVQLLAGHAADVAAWSWDADERKVTRWGGGVAGVGTGSTGLCRGKGRL